MPGVTMSLLRVSCKRCNRALEIPRPPAGETIRCSACRSILGILGADGSVEEIVAQSVVDGSTAAMGCEIPIQKASGRSTQPHENDADDKTIQGDDADLRVLEPPTQA